MDATCKIQDGIHMPRIIKKCVQDSGYISKPSLGAVLFVVIPATRTRKGGIGLATFPLG